MIKLDWKKIVYDHVWFGWYVDAPNNDRAWLWGPGPKGWPDRLWPVRRYGDAFPTWWHILWGLPLERDEHGDLIDDDD